MRSCVCHQMRLLTQRSSLRSLPWSTLQSASGGGMRRLRLQHQHPFIGLLDFLHADDPLFLGPVDDLLGVCNSTLGPFEKFLASLQPTSASGLHPFSALHGGKRPDQIAREKQVTGTNVMLKSCVAKGKRWPSAFGGTSRRTWGEVQSCVVPKVTAGNVLGPRSIPLSVDDSRSIVLVDAVARNLEEFQSTVLCISTLSLTPAKGMFERLENQTDSWECVNNGMGFMWLTQLQQRCLSHSFQGRLNIPMLLPALTEWVLEMCSIPVLFSCEKQSELRIARGWKLFMLLAVQTSTRWESPQDSTGRTFLVFQEADGWNCWLFAGRQSAKSISNPSTAAVKGRTKELRGGLGTQSGAFGRVVCSTSSPGRCQRCAGNDDHIERIDKPCSSSALRARRILSCWCKLFQSWQWGMCPMKWLMASRWVGWQHWQNPM